MLLLLVLSSKLPFWNSKINIGGCLIKRTLTCFTPRYLRLGFGTNVSTEQGRYILVCHQNFSSSQWGNFDHHDKMLPEFSQTHLTGCKKIGWVLLDLRLLRSNFMSCFQEIIFNSTCVHSNLSYLKFRNTKYKNLLNVFFIFNSFNATVTLV